jgi:vacuolar-type H+-ATPase subunit E/Vma4
MALSDLLSALRQHAAGQRAEALARADAEAQRILMESRAALERRRTEYVGRTRREEEEAARRARARAEAEATRSVLDARDRLLDRVAAALRERLGRAIGDPDYLALLPDQILGGLERLPPGPVVLRARPELIGIVRDVVRGRRDVVVEAEPELGVGFSASAPGSGVEVDGTLEAMLALSWPRVAVSVLREAGP